MSRNNISNNCDSNYNVKIVHSKNDYQSVSNLSDKAKTFLNSVFKELDKGDASGTNHSDGILQDYEGQVYIFSDGAVSVMKNNKLYAGMTKEGAETRVYDDCMVTKFSDGAETVTKNGHTVSGKTANNKKFIIKDGKIVFEEKEADKSTTNSLKSKHVTQEVKSKLEKKEKLDTIAEEYLEILSSITNNDNYDNVLNKKQALYTKYKKIFNKMLGSPFCFKSKELKTDKYVMQFSPVLNRDDMSAYWELWDVQKIGK